MANAGSIELHALASATAGTVTGDSTDLGEGRSAAQLLLRVTACSGTLAVKLQTSPDGATGWRDVRAFGIVGAISVQEISERALDRYVRIVATVGTSATFSVDGQAHQLYAEPRHLERKVARDILARIDSNEPDLIAEILIEASEDVEDALSAQREMPLTTIPATVRSRTADIAAYKLFSSSGFVGGGVDERVEKAYEEALAWMEDVRKRKKQPHGSVPAEGPATQVADAAASSRSSSSFVGCTSSNRWGNNNSV